MNRGGTQTSGSTSSGLIQRAKANDPMAWQQLCAIYGPLVYRWSRQAGLQDSDAADITQEVFRSVATNIEQFRRDQPTDSFRGWLYVIARNFIRQQFRRQRGNPSADGGTTAHVLWQELPETLPPEIADEPNPESKTLRRRAIESLRSQFQEKTWLAFWRTAIEGDSPNDVASDLGLSIWSVYQAKSRVLRRLRAELGDLLE